jgi:hypothetical protein
MRLIRVRSIDVRYDLLRPGAKDVRGSVVEAEFKKRVDELRDWANAKTLGMESFEQQDDA